MFMETNLSLYINFALASATPLFVLNIAEMNRQMFKFEKTNPYFGNDQILYHSELLITGTYNFEERDGFIFSCDFQIDGS